MDKIVSLKKPSSPRKTRRALPDISCNETIHYLKCYYVDNNTSLNDKKIMRLIDTEVGKKRQSYKAQDIKKCKYSQDTFVTHEQIYEKMISAKMLCYYCKGEVVVLHKTTRQASQWTLERLDNTYGHSNKNTVIACLDCNLKRGCRNSDAFQFAKQLTIKKI